nr:hypothetical protein [Tanacetum cinerariifolium]
GFTRGALLHYDAEIEVMNFILLSIPNEIYNSVDAFTLAKDVWKIVERLMRGTIQNRVDRETYFTNEFDQAKKLEKSHDPLALVAHTGSSSRNTSSYYVTHLTYVVDYDDEYQQDDIQTNSEDPLTSTMTLRNLSLRNTSNVQCYNCSGKGHYARNCPKPRVRDLKYFMEQMLLAKQDEAGVILTDEQNDFLFADALRMEEIKDPSANICLMAKIHPTNHSSDVGPSYDFAFVRNSLQGMFMLGPEPLSVYDQQLKHDLGYSNPYTLKQAISQCPKLYLASSLVDYQQINALYKDFVPQKELSAEQKYFPSSFIPSAKNSKETASIPASMPRMNDASSVRRSMNRDSHNKNSVLANSKNSAKKVAVYVRNNKQTDNTFANVISNKENVVQIILWIVDSGCSKHMTGDRSLLRNFIKKFMGTVHFRNDNFAAITCYGDYIQGNITIYHVYYVEGLGHNLFSVGQFCDGDLEVAFRSKTCYVRNLEGDDLLIGGRESNLYTISISGMAASSPTDLVNGLLKFKYEKDHFCSACERGKSKKASHPPKLVPSDDSKLELLHMDLCGPMRVASINGKKYILVIVDDYSRYTCVYFLHSNDETSEIIKKFIAQDQLNNKAKICKICTGNGTEFINANLKAYYEKLGIMQQFSTARTPQQNRVVERLATTCFTQNRSIIHTRYNKTPYELLRSRKLNVEYFHLFGSLCYPTNDRDDLGKMKPKADIRVFIGYSETSRGFRIYNRRTKKIMETIHVKFDELTAMASKHDCLELELQRFSNINSSAEPINTLSKEDLDNLFGPMFEEYFGKKSFDTPINSTAQPTQLHEDLPSTSSINIKEHEAPPIKTASDEQTSLISLIEADELHQEDYADFDGNSQFVSYNPTSYEVIESSSMALEPSNVQNFHQVQPSTHSWTKDYPLDQVIGDPSKPVMTRQRLHTDSEVCMYALTVSTIKPKNIKEAMADHSWIESMQDELNQFKRLKVWETFQDQKERILLLSNGSRRISVKENQERDKIGSKQDKNRKRIEARKSLKQLQWIKEEKPKKTQKEWSKTHTR